jgi:FixJ family two-component response regulator
MGGEETFRELKTIRPDVRVILSSGYNEVEAVRRFTGKGLAGFIQKPYSAIALAEKVRSVLAELHGVPPAPEAGP